ncbi:hypothetical protein [Fulvimonas soli]|jgi:hypothetical protein|uniref:hypothetical protein n=1 Tax=Fulvimonas soli TaxID=155197 RepID=UPI00112030C2|nr:hypothetical protein [Fulvimonas soli]
MGGEDRGGLPLPARGPRVPVRPACLTAALGLYRGWNPANEPLSRCWPLDTVAARAGPLLSAALHLLLALDLLALPATAGRAAPSARAGERR